MQICHWSTRAIWLTILNDRGQNCISNSCLQISHLGGNSGWGGWLGWWVDLYVHQRRHIFRRCVSTTAVGFVRWWRPIPSTGRRWFSPSSSSWVFFVILVLAAPFWLSFINSFGPTARRRRTISVGRGRMSFFLRSRPTRSTEMILHHCSIVSFVSNIVSFVSIIASIIVSINVLLLWYCSTCHFTEPKKPSCSRTHLNVGYGDVLLSK